MLAPSASQHNSAPSFAPQPHASPLSENQRVAWHILGALIAHGSLALPSTSDPSSVETLFAVQDVIAAALRDYHGGR